MRQQTSWLVVCELLWFLHTLKFAVDCWWLGLRLRTVLFRRNDFALKRFAASAGRRRWTRSCRRSSAAAPRSSVDAFFVFDRLHPSFLDVRLRNALVVDISEETVVGSILRRAAQPFRACRLVDVF